MKTIRNFTLAAAAATAIGLFTPNAHAQLYQQKMDVTFSAPVEVGGKVLPAGKYVFEALQAGRMTRVLSADETHVYETVFTVPEERDQPVAAPTIMWGENAAGAPSKVDAWFFPGETIGNEFMK